MSLSKKYPTVFNALKDVQKKSSELRKLFDKNDIFSKNLRKLYNKQMGMDGYWIQAGPPNPILDNEDDIKKSVLNRRNFFRNHHDSYSHSAIFIEKDMKEYLISFSKSEKLTLEDNLDIKNYLERIFRAVKRMVAPANRQPNYCQRMSSCLEIANRNTYLLEGTLREKEIKYLTAIKENMPAEYKKAEELAESVNQLEKAVKDCGLMEQLDKEIEKDDKKMRHLSKPKAFLLEIENIRRLTDIDKLIKQMFKITNTNRLSYLEIKDKYIKNNTGNEAIKKRLDLLDRYDYYSFNAELSLSPKVSQLIKNNNYTASTNSLKAGYKNIFLNSRWVNVFNSVLSDVLKDFESGTILSEKHKDWEKGAIKKMKADIKIQLKKSYQLAGALEELERSMVTKAYNSGKKEHADFAKVDVPFFRISDSSNKPVSLAEIFRLNK